eukprot:jgi/Mesen1/9574/ME000065S09000
MADPDATEVDWIMIEDELSALDDIWKQPRFDSLPHVVEVLTSRNPQQALQKLSDQRDAVEFLVDEVVQGYHNGFNKAIHNYSQILKLFSESASQMSGLKKSLSDARRLLSTRQKHLQQLWYRSITMRHVLSLIDQIDNVAKVPERIQKLMVDKQLYTAVQLHIHSVAMLEREGIQGVGGLREVRNELAKLRGQLFYKVVDELHAHLYNKGDYSVKLEEVQDKDDDISSIVVAAVPASAALHPSLAGQQAAAAQVQKKARAGRSMRRSNSELKGLSIDTTGSYSEDRDEDPPTPSSEVSGSSSTPAFNTHDTSSAATSVLTRKHLQSLPPWLKEAKVNDFTEMMMKNESPNHVKYLLTLVECLALLSKVAAAGAILSQRLRSTVRELIMSEIKARAIAAEAARPRMEQVTKTSAAAGSPLPKAMQMPAGSPAKTPGKKAPQKTPQKAGAAAAAAAAAAQKAGKFTPAGPTGVAQTAAQELLESVMDMLIRVLENHVLASAIMDTKAADMAQMSPVPSPTGGGPGGGGEPENYNESTGGYSSEVQQLICDVLMATPDGASADAATARLANLRVLDDGSNGQSLSFSFRFAESGLAAAGGEGAGGTLGGDGLFHTRAKRGAVLGQEGFGTSTALPDRGIYLTSACYRPVLQFTERVCALLPPAYAELGKHGLRPFIDNFVKDQFLPSIRADYRSRVADALSGPSAFRPKARNSGAMNGAKAANHEHRHILQGPLTVEALVEEVLSWAQAMPVYAADFVALVHTLLERTLERCRAAFTEAVLGSLSRALVGRADTEHLMRQQAASQLLEDDDILPADFEAAREDPPVDSEAYEIDMELYNELFGYMPIDARQVITEGSKLVLLAALSDTLLYLSDSIFALGQGAGVQQNQSKRRLPTGPAHRKTPSGGLALTGGLARLSESYRELSRECLMTLRLEMQLQCIFHLQSMAERSYVLETDPEEPEDFIVALTSQMTRLEEEMALYLQAPKRSYVFGGVCGLAATALIRSLGRIVERERRINALGVRQVQRNCIALQQTLATLGANSSSSVQQSLDRVGEYYELLNRPYEALMAYVRDHDRYFTLEEYAMLLQIHVPSRNVPADAVEKLRRVLVS